MNKLFAGAAQGFKTLFSGLGYVPPPQPGNTANAPANPSVQTGSYGFIIPQMFDGVGTRISDIPEIPPAFRDWGQMPLNLYGLSGLEGGGSTGAVPNVNQGAALYYDPDSGSYVDLGLLGAVGVTQ